MADAQDLKLRRQPFSSVASRCNESHKSPVDIGCNRIPCGCDSVSQRRGGRVANLSKYLSNETRGRGSRFGRAAAYADGFVFGKSGRKNVTVAVGRARKISSHKRSCLLITTSKNLAELQKGVARLSVVGGGSPIWGGGVLYRVKLTVKEYARKQRGIYTHELIEMEMPAGKRVQAAQEGPTSTPQAGTVPTVADVLGNVNEATAIRCWGSRAEFAGEKVLHAGNRRN